MTEFRVRCIQPGNPFHDRQHDGKVFAGASSHVGDHICFAAGGSVLLGVDYWECPGYTLKIDTPLSPSKGRLCDWLTLPYMVSGHHVAINLKRTDWRTSSYGYDV